jgi:hypothetical protein
MDTPEPTESADPVVPIPEHLRPTILDVVERQIEFAADNAWNTSTRNRIVAAVHLWEATVASTLTAAQTVTVADLAIAWIEPRWPKNADAVINVAKLLEEARELIDLRDRALALAHERGERFVASDTRDPSISSEVPDRLLPVLRHAADEALERACDNGGEWDDEIRTQVLDAARIAAVFDLALLPPAQIAELADYALKWAEPSVSMPNTTEKLGDDVTQLEIARELVKLRDRARQRAEPDLPDSIEEA